MGTGTGTLGRVFGTRDSETRGLGRGDACKRGRGTRGRGDVGTGTPGRVFGTRDSETRGLGREDTCKRGRGDVGTRRRGDARSATRGGEKQKELLRMNIKCNFQRIKGR